MTTPENCGSYGKCGLYFHSSEPEVANRVLALLKMILPSLRQAWQLGETYRQAAQQEGIRIEELPANALICRTGGEIIAVNQRFKAFAARTGDIFRSPPSGSRTRLTRPSSIGS